MEIRHTRINIHLKFVGPRPSPPESSSVPGISSLTGQIYHPESFYQLQRQTNSAHWQRGIPFEPLPGEPASTVYLASLPSLISAEIPPSKENKVSHIWIIVLRMWTNLPEIHISFTLFGPSPPKSTEGTGCCLFSSRNWWNKQRFVINANRPSQTQSRNANKLIRSGSLILSYGAIQVSRSISRFLSFVRARITRNPNPPSP